MQVLFAVESLVKIVALGFIVGPRTYLKVVHLVF